MRHHIFTAAMGIVLGSALVPLSVTAAAAADPTGYWRKAAQGERPGKMQVFRCGSGKRYLCAKIVWLQNSLDSKGRPLRDVRNENPSLRGRQIMGLPIVNGMAPVGANRWKGNIYNPEDGNTYSATLTLVSQNKIHLKGCKAWLLCGERTWLRTSLPKPEPEPTTQVEAAAEPEVEPETAIAAASSGPGAKDAFAETEMMMTPSSQQSEQAGYRFLNASTEGPTGLSGDDVSSMFMMTTPLETDARQTAPVSVAVQPKPSGEAAPAAQSTSSAPSQPPAQPAPQTIQANAASTAAPAAADEPAAEGTEPDPTETAEALGVDTKKLSWRERRQLRRQQRLRAKQGDGSIPWLR